MSFTEDELQAFNNVLEQRLSAHRREMERAFELRTQVLRRELEQRLLVHQQEIIRTLTHKIADQQKDIAQLNQKLITQQFRINQEQARLNQEVEQKEQLFEGVVERSLASQLQSIEELLKEQLTAEAAEQKASIAAIEQAPHFEAIEVQTELPWEDLIAVFGKALDERLAVLAESTQVAIKDWEQYLSLRLQTLQTQLTEQILHRMPQPYNGGVTSMQEVFQSIEQLARLIESMQVAMTSNHALISNRLYHHQQLPLDRAHPGAHAPSTTANGTGSQLSLSQERENK